MMCGTCGTSVPKSLKSLMRNLVRNCGTSVPKSLKSFNVGCGTLTPILRIGLRLRRRTSCSMYRDGGANEGCG